MIENFRITFFSGGTIEKNGDEWYMEYVKAFLVGGLICVVGQLLIDYTKLTPARILVTFVTCGVLLTALGLYEPLVEFGGSGATVPLSGFGYSLAKGVEKAIEENGFLGIFTGGFTACAGGLGAVVLFGLIAALCTKSRTKK